MRAAAVVALAVVVVVAGGAYLFSKDDADRSGIRGRVTGGCIVEGCHPVPKVGLQRVLRWTATTNKPFPLVKKFWSAEDGTFEVSLPSGHYMIDQDPKSPADGLMEPLEVTVRKGKFTEVDPFYDIGMRG